MTNLLHRGFGLLLLATLLTACENRAAVEREISEAREELNQLASKSKQLELQLTATARDLEDASTKGLSDFKKAEVEQHVAAMESDIAAAQVDQETAAREEQAAQARLDAFKARYLKP